MFQRQKKSHEAAGNPQDRKASEGGPSSRKGKAYTWRSPVSAASPRVSLSGRSGSRSRTTSRTTSYPQGMEGAPRRVGASRTTSYPQPMQTSYRGYQSIN